jgi:peroxiredoxin
MEAPIGCLTACPATYKSLMSQSSQARLLLRASARLPRFALLALLLLGPAVCVPATQLVGQPAPDFALRSWDGGNMRLSEHTGEVVLINFWATWCGPCRQEMPLLDEIYGKYRRAGLVLFSVNLDEETNLDAAREMAKTLRVSYPVLFDARKEVSRAYQASTMPLTVLIDREGVVRYVSEGYKVGYETRYTEKLRELLNE